MYALPSGSLKTPNLHLICRNSSARRPSSRSPILETSSLFLLMLPVCFGSAFSLRLTTFSGLRLGNVRKTNVKAAKLLSNAKSYQSDWKCKSTFFAFMHGYCMLLSKFSLYFYHWFNFDLFSFKMKMFRCWLPCSLTASDIIEPTGRERKRFLALDNRHLAPKW